MPTTRGNMERELEHPELVQPADVARFLAEWDTIQASFVDDPQGAVAHADRLVAELTSSLQAELARHRSELERQWAQGEAVSTERLRTVLQRYRTLVQRLCQHA